MIWNPDIECAEHGKIEEIQLRRLQETVRNVYENVPMYKERLDSVGLKPSDIRSLDDLSRIPFTTKADLRDHYPYGLFARPMKDVVRIHASSGTTGQPTVVGYTRKDLDTWSEVMARIIAMAGVTEEDIAQIAFGYGLFTGGFGLHYGLEKVGASVIPISSGNTERQIRIMRDFGTTVLVSTPSYALYLVETAEKMGIDPKTELKVRTGLFGGEGSTEAMRKQLESRWGMLATQNYGLSEIIGPGVSGECAHKCGLHIAEDHFIAEIIDPVTGEVLPMGEKGELVLTSISKEAFPLLRYRTRDLTRLIREKCECGRTSMRMEKIQGRSDDMLVIRGVNVFPSQIESVLVDMDEVGPHYQIIVRREGYMDSLEIKVEMLDASLLDVYKGLEKLEEKIRAALRSTLLIDAKIHLVEPNSLERFEGKAKRVIDLRNLKD